MNADAARVLQEVTTMITRLKRVAAHLESVVHSPRAAEVLDDRVGVIKHVVAEHFGVPVLALDARLRTANASWARQVAMALCRELLNKGWSEIGRAFGNRDHGTVTHGVNVVMGRCEVYAETRAEVELVRVKVMKKLDGWKRGNGEKEEACE